MSFVLILSNSSHPLKAVSDIDFIVEGIDSDLSDEQPLNTLSSICSTPSSNITVSRDIQFLYA